MKWFKGKEKTVDERIVNIQNKIYKEVYVLIMALCFVSIAVKFYLSGINIEAVFLELTIFFITGLYWAIRAVSLGIYSDEIEIHDRKSKTPMTVKTMIAGLVFGVAIAVFFGIRSSILYGGSTNGLWYFILVFFASLMIYIPLFFGIITIPHLIAKKASEKAAQKSED